MEANSCLDFKRTHSNTWFHGKWLPADVKWQNMNTVWSSVVRVRCLHHILCKKSCISSVAWSDLVSGCFISAQNEITYHTLGFFSTLSFFLLQDKSPLDSLTQVKKNPFEKSNWHLFFFLATSMVPVSIDIELTRRVSLCSWLQLRSLLHFREMGKEFGYSVKPLVKSLAGWEGITMLCDVKMIDTAFSCIFI